MPECKCEKTEINDYLLPIVENIQLTDKIFWMTFKSHELANMAKSGNSLMVFPTDKNDPLLGRPFTVAYCDKAADKISICYMKVGKGTDILSKLKVNSVLRVRGLIGCPHPEIDKQVILAGGGVGIAALLMKKLSTPSSELFCGIPGKGYEGYAKKIKSFFSDAKIFTDDFSFGDGDSMFKVLPKQLGNKELWSCGPIGFSKALHRFYANEEEKLYYILDKRMACGFGGCMGCVVKTKSGLKRICVDKTIFRADEVDLDEF